MNIEKEYSRKEIIQSILTEINNYKQFKVRMMEVCGGHTMSIHKHGIHSLLPDNITLLSGPGCPVCVTGTEYIDRAIAMSYNRDVIITTYGDLIRVPGSEKSLQDARSENNNIRIVYSTLDALKIAEQNPEKKTVFLGIGFETTSPASGAAILEAEKKGIDNFYLYSSHKIMQPAMEALVCSGESDISAYICPGHVSVITGTSIYMKIASEYRIPCVVSGFEPADILNAVLYILRQIAENRSEVEIAYRRAVTEKGNVRAREVLEKVFEKSDSNWRGLGVIPGSGLKLKAQYSKRDAEIMIPAEISLSSEKKGCICGSILRGIKTPSECPLFGSVCTPSNPAGACMVSSEGSCAAWYRYKR